MLQNIIERHVQRVCRNLLLVHIPIFVLALLPLVLSWRYIYNCAAGPAPVPAERFATVTHPSEIGMEFIEMTEAQPPNPITHAALEKLRAQSPGAWSAAQVRDRAVLLRDGTVENGRVRGKLVVVEEPLRSAFENTLPRGGTETFNTYFLPIRIEAGWYRIWLLPLFGFTLPLLAWSGRHLLRALAHMHDYRKSPIYTALRRTGDPEQILELLEQELRRYPVNSDLLRTYLSPTFLLHDSAFTLTVVRISDIVRIQRHTPKDAGDPAAEHRVEVVDKYGVKVICAGPGPGVDRFVQALPRQPAAGATEPSSPRR